MNNGGGTLELTVRVNEEPQAEAMRQAVHQLVSEAREALERAARKGEQPLQWVQAFMSPAWWERYHQLCEEADHSDQTVTTRSEQASHTGGVASSGMELIDEALNFAIWTRCSNGPGCCFQNTPHNGNAGTRSTLLCHDLVFLFRDTNLLCLCLILIGKPGAGDWLRFLPANHHLPQSGEC